MFLKSPTAASIHVALLSGHAIQIGPEGREVPEMFKQKAFEKGAQIATQDASEETEETISAERLALLVAGIKTMLTDFPDQFTAAGLPNRKKLAAVVGSSVSETELAAAWVAVNSEAAA